MLYKKKYRVKLYSWCLMDNHVHFILEPTNKKGLAKLFGALNTKYVKYFNKKYEMIGRLFGDRFFSCVLDEEHFYEAIRYVELNPYRAKLEKNVGTYFWSSSLERLQRRNQFYLNKLPSWFQINNWFEYLQEGVEEDQVIQQSWAAIRGFTINGTPLGKKSFIEMVKDKVGAIFKEKFRVVNRPVVIDSIA